VTREEFGRLYGSLFPKAQAGSAARAFAALDLEGAGRVDIISWSHRISLADMPGMVERMRRHGGCGWLALWQLAGGWGWRGGTACGWRRGAGGTNSRALLSMLPVPLTHTHTHCVCV
jgi:hypothetical protein